MDMKGFPYDIYMPTGRNVGRVEYVHGGVARNVVEDIANVELRPTYVSIVDDTPLGAAIYQKLKNHKVNMDYVLTAPEGMGTWLAVFDNNGDVAGSISSRPDFTPIMGLLEEKGDEIIENADSVVLQVDLAKEIVKKVIELAKKQKIELFFPELKYCGDNGATIGAQAYYEFKAGKTAGLDLNALSAYSIEKQLC